MPNIAVQLKHEQAVKKQLYLKCKFIQEIRKEREQQRLNNVTDGKCSSAFVFIDNKNQNENLWLRKRRKDYSE